MRIVVVGGGIVGCSSAHYLAQRGADVVLCERSNIGAGSTERSAGGIRAQFSTPVNVALSRASMRVWDRFEDEFDADISHRRSGYLFLARTDDSVEELAETVAMQNEQGVPSESLTPEEALEHCPGLRADRFRSATYSPTDGFADPHLALQAFATRAREDGVDIRTGVEVTDVLRDGGGVTGVETTAGPIDADFVVNAAGPWAGRVAAMAGLDLPISPERRQIAVVDPETPVPESVPLVIDLDTGLYFRPEREGAAIVGGHFGGDTTVDPNAYDHSSDLDWTIDAVEKAAELATYFGPDSRIRRGWAGLYAVTPDHHPIIEETISGFVNAVGFSGHGFQHAPATGQLVTELVFDGEASLVDISGLDSARFADGRTVDERNVA
ncbi:MULTISPECIES: FAD-dependent oxidoreductase [unclassified Haladaptatus]|uniref:NAD(P)/FAD-dependent oxidoreductase n=1 Tax=unclassified Haladaptatus TaxID=2622732 RepID=UPI00209BFED4|nr:MULTISPECIES: FAD-dependent oxidoreductase [unclassified Haladaptatus]MCO8246321.1 FAD-binding oxidoreductase [Haladaptatus sp. AB643]MCO8255224.1 FAD-binding oxidoreductase [Haladaptatus sp. AB618]